MRRRRQAIWIEVAPNLWSWGDWHVALRGHAHYLIVSSGEEYGPFVDFMDAINYAGEIIS